MDEKQIIETQDGSHSIFSERFGVPYHSKYGAIQESRHVFIEAGLYLQALSRKTVTILEIGFGTGLNAFLTLLESEKRGFHTEYVAVEAFPVDLKQVRQLNYPELLGEPPRTEEFYLLHEAEWNKEHRINEYFLFRKVRGAFEEIDFQEAFDLLYFDAFAPNAQPELWEYPVLERMYRALRKEGVLVTYCAKGVVKRRFKALGFEVETIKGPPGKREMIRCRKN